MLFFQMNGRHASLAVLVVGFLLFGAGCSQHASTTNNPDRPVMTNVTVGKANILTPGVTFNPHLTPANANTNTSTSSVTVLQAVNNAPHYKDKTVCLTGHYQLTSTFSGFGASVKPNGVDLNQPFVWVYQPDASATLSCADAGAGHKTCSGLMTVCGPFRYNPNGGLGQSGKYSYAIDGEATVK